MPGIPTNSTREQAGGDIPREQVRLDIDTVVGDNQGDHVDRTSLFLPKRRER